MNEDLGPYRSVLAHPPGRAVFERLCALLGDRERPEDDPVVTYLSGHLRSWPDAIERPAPEAWLIDAVYAGAPVPALALCNTLTDEAFGCGFDSGDFDALVGLHAGFRHVAVGSSVMGSEAAALIAGCEGLSLSSLRIGFSLLQDSDLSLLAGAAHMEGVEVLDVRYNALTDLGVLADTPLLRGLKELRAQKNSIGGGGLARVLSRESVDALERIDLRYNPVGEEGAAAFAESPWLTSLEWLSLYVDDVGERGAAALARSRTLPGHVTAYWRAA